eukprot:TRINITY_DN7545_c0_g3_i1.p1 TRINITY_DN7545_c0_g3~~TRINITY_DN7545_c0_g3_i1.p1  ORF type:complete len:244 (-),score=43.99 TRINITY_DN7545_c0_g3_i1:86-772(-)
MKHVILTLASLFLCTTLGFISSNYHNKNLNAFPDKLWTKEDLPVPSTAYIPQTYPLYLQCDPIWANDYMGGNSTPFDTVCAQGCAMSSLAMALHGKGYYLNSYYPIYSGTLNAWLRNNKGYTCIDGDCDNLVLDAPNRLSSTGGIKFISESVPPSISQMKQWVNAQDPTMIIHVRNQTHFVLVVGYDTANDTVFYVNDPAFNTNTYYYSDIHDILLYSIVDQTKSETD